MNFTIEISAAILLIISGIVYVVHGIRKALTAAPNASVLTLDQGDTIRLERIPQLIQALNGTSSASACVSSYGSGPPESTKSTSERSLPLHDTEPLTTTALSSD